MTKFKKVEVDQDFERLKAMIECLAMKFPYGSAVGGGLLDLNNRVSRLKDRYLETYQAKLMEKNNESN